MVITAPGGPEMLQVRDVSDPACGPEELLVAVRATALNRADLLQRRGHYPAPAGAPADIPGLEFAGEVVARGERVRGFSSGDRVMGILGGGGYAERVALHERLCLPIPPALDWVLAAAVPEAFLTAYDALFLRGGLSPGENLLVHAAASGVGTAAAQLARIAGATVVGLIRTATKRQGLLDLGLDHVLDAADPDLTSRIMAATHGAGIDLVLDAVGAGAWSLNAGVLRERGRWVVIGLMGGSLVEVDLALLMSKRLTVTGSVLRSRAIEEKGALVQEFGRRMLPLLASGRLQPLVDRTFDWRDAADAHRYMERNANVGKIVLTLPGDAAR